MLSELSHQSLKNEIQFLRIDLNRLGAELNTQQFYQTFYYIPAVADGIARKMALYNWKQRRLEALELFARAQFAITQLSQPAAAPVHFACTERTYKRKRRKNKNRAIVLSGDPRLNSVPQNKIAKDSNRENHGPPSTQALTNQGGTDTVKNIKIEDCKENIAQSIADTLKNLKTENIDHDQISVLNNNINANFIPQLLPVANVKVEGVDCNIVDEANESRKRKMSRSERRCSKRAKTD